MPLRDQLFKVLFFTLAAFIPIQGFAQIGYPSSYQNGVVVSTEFHASQVGVDIMRKGGNAVDAAVAVQFALAVTSPSNGNIGGGGFMVVKMKGKTYALDFRERAPLNATTDMYIQNGKVVPGLSTEGALAIGVPGSVAGMVKALERFGNLSLETVMQPAIDLARKGFPLSLSMAHSLNRNKDDFSKYETTKHYFTKGDGKMYHEGELFVQKDLADALERIAKNGRAGFYSGPTADLFVKTMQKYGGLITHEDLKAYEAIWREPITAQYGGYTLHIMPPPSSGGVVIGQMLRMLKPYDLKELGYNTAKYVHLITEVMRRAFADRAYFLGDPDFVKLPLETLLSEGYLQKRMDSFEWKQATPSEELSHGKIPAFKESMQTTNYSVVDKWGNAVAVTTTLNGGYGSNVVVGGAGFFLNNEMDDFTSKPGVANMFGLIQGKVNAIEPGKRMLSSMSPTIVTKDGDVRMVLGAAGGPRIITAVFQMFLNGYLGMNAQEAVSAPRFHHQWMPDILFYEPFGIDKVSRQKLESWGHHLRASHVATANAIFVNDEGVHGATDPRDGDGAPAGY